MKMSDPDILKKLIQDVIDLSDLEDYSRILEVGCGTGKATRPFAERGYELICLDIGADLIAVAKEKLRTFPNVSFVEQGFEKWESDWEFDLIISATAFHWIDPKVRYLKASEVLRSDGFLAVFSNQHVRKDEGFFAESQSLYDKYYFPLTIDRPLYTRHKLSWRRSLSGSNQTRLPVDANVFIGAVHQTLGDIFRTHRIAGRE